MSFTYYSRIKTSSLYRTNQANLSFPPIVSTFSNWWSGSNAVFNGQQLASVTSITVSNSTFSNTSTPLSTSATSIVYRVPNLAAANLYTITFTSVSGVSSLPIYGSLASNQVTYTANGVSTFTVPNGVYDISILCIGAGGKGNGRAGGGGGLAYYNNYPVTPGQQYTITIANNASYNAGGNATFSFGATVIVNANGGMHGFVQGGSVSANAAGGGYNGIEGVVGNYGGSGGGSDGGRGSGGGGAAGYSANGGNGSRTWFISYPVAGSPTNGAGGGGGGGAAYYDLQNLGTRLASGGGGGGVGIYGQTTGTGAAGTNGNLSPVGGGTTFMTAAQGGSRGSNGTVGSIGSALGSSSLSGGAGGSYGGGGGSSESTFPNEPTPAAGGNNVVRIIWGPNRFYPNTNTIDL